MQYKQETENHCRIYELEGGTLIVGIDDRGNSLGLEKDYDTFPDEKIGMARCNILLILSKIYWNRIHEQI